MRSLGGNRTVAHPVMRQWESCHVVKDTPWADGGIGLSFRTIRWFLGVEWGILRLIVWVSPKQNHLLFDRLITDVRDKWSSFNRYENTVTLSPCCRMELDISLEFPSRTTLSNCLPARPWPSSSHDGTAELLASPGWALTPASCILMSCCPSAVGFSEPPSALSAPRWSRVVWRAGT